MKLEFQTLSPPPENAEKPITSVFIDYESLYISFQKQFQTTPDLATMIEEVKKHGKVLKIKVFGDFTKPEINQERGRIRTITSDIIDCGNESTVLRKDFTDFIMLDHMYQEIIQNPMVTQFVMFTGDGHFSSIATFLKTFMDKSVGVYGIPGTLSHQLRGCASWVKYIKVVDDDDSVYQSNILRNLRKRESMGKYSTFRKSAEFCAKEYGGSEAKYELILREMLEAGYMTRYPIDVNGIEIMAISPIWEKITAELTVVA